jgi:hypothetical protein
MHAQLLLLLLLLLSSRRYGCSTGENVQDMPALQAFQQKLATTGLVIQNTVCTST